MVGRPGKYLIVMIWWIMAAFFVQLPFHPLWRYFSSYLAYFVVFFFALVVATLLNVMESRAGSWSRRGVWGKFVLLATAYTVTMMASLIVTIVLDGYRVVAYFGADACGSVGLLYLPSIGFYWVAGGVVCGILQWWKPGRG